MVSVGNRFTFAPRRFRIGVILLAIACSLFFMALTYVVTRELSRRIEAQAQSQFEVFATETSNTINGQMNRYVDVLLSLRGLWDVVGGMPSRQQFEDFAASLQTDTRFPSLVSLNYADLVDTPDTAAYQAAVRVRDNMPAFTVYPVYTPNPHRLIVRYGPTNLAYLYGRDILVNFTTASTIYQHSVHDLTPYMSGIAVPWGKGKPKALGVRLSVFPDGKVPNPTASNRMPTGSVGIFINVVTLVHSVIPQQRAGQIHLTMISLPNADDGPGGNRDLVDLGPSLHEGPDVLSRVLRTEVAQRHFVTTIRAPLVAFEEPVGAHIRAIAYTTGILLSVMAGLLVYLLLSSRTRLMQTVMQQSSNLDRNRVLLEQLLSDQLNAEQEIARQGEHERQRIGRELHDDLGQRLTGASLMLNALAKQQSREADGEKIGGLTHIARIVDGSVDTIRALSRGLSPFDDGSHKLQSALRELCEELNGLLKDGCALSIDYDTELLSTEAQLHIYRIIQEAVVNAIRHGHARRIAIAIVDREGKPTLSIQDDGDGIDTTSLADDTYGLGLRSIRSRAKNLGLSLHLSAVPGGGTLVEIS